MKHNRRYVFFPMDQGNLPTRKKTGRMERHRDDTQPKGWD
jgi:hypothetical protein